MQLGTLLPLGDIGGEPAVVREYAQAAEAIGYDFLEAPDHVVGVNAASRPGWERNTSADLFHDPFVLFGFLAGISSKLGFATGVLILPQRQAVLVAKQAACLDVLCGGRFRLGVGVGWNEVEFTALNENFHNRGRRSEEQIAVMQALWRQPHVSFKGRWHTIEDAGINPRPAAGKVPVWFGGHHERTLERIARLGDGWMPNAYQPNDEALAIFDRLRALTRKAGRDPAAVGLEVWVSMGSGTEADWARTTTFNRRHHRRIAGRTLADHLAALRRYHAAVAEFL
jgi:probable F420-dependent oxidoreductase